MGLIWSAFFPRSYSPAEVAAAHRAQLPSSTAAAAAADPHGADATFVLTDARGIEIFVRYWPLQVDGGKAPRQLRGIVVLSHGYSSHSGSFTAVAAALNAAGYSAVGLDLPGHGRSGGPLPHCRGVDFEADPRWVDAIELVFNHAVERLAPPGTPAFIYAESISGAATLHLLLRPAAAARLAGAITAGAAGGTPLGQLLPLLSLWLPVVCAMGRMLPSLPLAPRAAMRLFFALQHGDPARGRKVFDTDRLVIHSLRAGCIATITPIIAALATAPLKRIETPVLVLQGNPDVFLPPANADLLRARLARSRHCRSVVFPGMTHWLSQGTPAHVEAVVGEVLAFMGECVDQWAARGVRGQGRPRPCSDVERLM